MEIQAYRGSIFHFVKQPFHQNDSNCYQFISDGLLVIENGKIAKIGNTSDIKPLLNKNINITDYSDHLITAGFIDTHIHYPQGEIIASYGDQLLEWLNRYVFPAEKKYAKKDYADTNAQFFLQELLRNGTTTAVIYSTVHEISADVLFARAADLNMRIITGKTLMDRNAPDYLRDTPEKSYTESKNLITKWHGHKRLLYAITPRFAPTSTEAQLEVANNLLKEFPTTYLQTHVSENISEVAWVKDLFPWSKNYLDIYDHFDLLGSKSLFGHAIHFSDEEFQRIKETNSVITWCPTSNFFLGSGLFNIGKAKHYGNRIGSGTDVGGGSSFSMLQTLNEAYKVAALQNIKLSPLESWYHISLGNAQALSLEDKIGNLEVGKEADFIVIDLNCTPLLTNKNKRAQSIEEKLFNLSVLGDDRAIKATYIYGKLAHARDVMIK